ncbi:uncharacterized protein I303_100128 [Kwoniella dejecticola CBS 10117]|uniref:protein-tyrosine-phosphatase n=1 Tax=Kwoniella dejecticola CBS 10117 TaxID=1296121 RepID=A0A1A6AE18_9TREE|nr:uncharacterized protein I303_00128 [Kwoniella dejecticola CBS 10117]OBR88317.1 hypothetical protein I303_00128 [Kwoniella dejecticola CBS 10117]
MSKPQAKTHLNVSSSLPHTHTQAHAPLSTYVSTIRPFPNPVAVFNEQFIFTSLTERQVQAHGKMPYKHPQTGRSVLLFSLDEEMQYTPFASDHGPLNLAFTVQALVRIHDRLELTEARKKPLCLYTTDEPTKKSCMTLVVALFFLIVGRQAPWEAFRPIAPLEIMPFRDAGSGPMDYGLSIQDILYGVDKALLNGLLDLANFDQEAYQKYEQVDNGDLNILGPFIPFASPMEERWIKAVKTTTRTVSTPRGTARTTMKTVKKGEITSNAMKCVMEVFEKEKVGLVVRLNDELYDRRHFLDLGMDHVEMYFHDGSNPSDEIVREFIRLVDEVIEGRGQKVAVHCKAGLGRTGVLIGAYLIYKYQFTAQEAIGYMRIVRPGMVVGPQQHYMVINQMKWVGWAARDQLLRELAAETAPQDFVNPLATPPLESTMFPTNSPRSIGSYPKEATIQISEHKDTRRAGTLTIKVTEKGGDAVGQPRKTPARLRLSETLQLCSPAGNDLAVVLEPTSPPILTHPSSTKDGLNEWRNTQTTPEPETPPAPTSGSMRGTKRSAGSGRSPIPNFKSSPPRVTLAVPAPALSRSTSTASMSSISSSDQDARPPKRRSPTGSPLARNGSSSPPPSRESSPVIPILALSDEGMQVDNDGEPRLEPPVTPVLKQTKLTGKLRRRVASPSPSPPVDSAPQSSSVLLCESGKAINALNEMNGSASPKIIKRSFLPVRKNVPQHYLDPKDTTLIPQPPSTPSRKAVDEVRSSTPKRLTTTTKRSILTPPRITEMWGQLAKIGSSSPASEAKCEWSVCTRRMTMKG